MVKDFKDIEYPTVVAMCNAYNIDYHTYKERRKRGWSLKRALTERKAVHRYECIDAKGQVYTSETARCIEYDIWPTNYFKNKNNPLWVTIGMVPKKTLV